MAPALLPHADAAVPWLRARVRGQLRCDSRQVQPGDGFIAWPGAAHDARAHVAAAQAAGAQACLVEADGAEAFNFQAEVAGLHGLKPACGLIADAWYGAPSAALAVIAVTGTNGKSSIAWWTAQALTLLGRRCGLVGTLGVGQPPLAGQSAAITSTGLTTPDPFTLQAAFRAFVDQGYAACAIEASSIGLAEARLAGTRIAVAQFSNLTRDHLDYHGDMAAYWQAKRSLFAWPGLRAAVLNIDDTQGAALAQGLSAAGGSATQAPQLDLWTTAQHAPARLRAAAPGYDAAGLHFEVREGSQTHKVSSQLIGDYNADNLLVVLATLRALGFGLEQALSVVPQLSAVPGRMQRVAGATRSPQVVVDYAHTPDALDKALAALRRLAKARGGKLWCVFGCGGNRDASKRALMGAIAARGADAVLITSDNPRHEPAQAIIEQIRLGAGAAVHVQLQLDRRFAIAQAVAQADARDVLLIAGKGHEDYQEVAGQRLPFSDVDEAAEALRRREVQP